MFEVVEVSGDVPSARFGHTITGISKHKVVLFGGAIGDLTAYETQGDSYIFNTQTRVWTKLPTLGPAPAPRAAHAATMLETLQLVVYGGAAGGRLDG
jgi:protein phosphatase